MARLYGKAVWQGCMDCPRLRRNSSCHTAGHNFHAVLRLGADLPRIVGRLGMGHMARTYMKLVSLSAVYNALNLTEYLGVAEADK